MGGAEGWASAEPAEPARPPEMIRAVRRRRMRAFTLLLWAGSKADASLRASTPFRHKFLRERRTRILEEIVQEIYRSRSEQRISNVGLLNAHDRLQAGLQTAAVAPGPTSSSATPVPAWPAGSRSAGNLAANLATFSDPHFPPPPTSQAFPYPSMLES